MKPSYSIGIVLLIAFLLTGCAGARHISVKPWTAESTVQVPGSVKIKFIGKGKVQFGNRMTPIVVHTENIREALKDFIKMRGTFKEITETDSDFVLEVRILDIQFKNTFSGFLYTTKMRADIYDKEGIQQKTYISRAELVPSSTSRVTSDLDRESVNRIMNSAFADLCRQIEQDFAK